MIVTNFVRRNMRILQRFQATASVIKSELIILRSDGYQMRIELSREEKEKLIRQLGGWHQPTLPKFKKQGSR